MFWLAFFAVVSLALAYQKPSLKTATWTLGGAIAFYGVFGDSGWAFFFLLLAFAAVFVPLNLPELRQEWFSRPALEFFRKVLPELSDTERTALDAGTVWWDGELFSGRPNWARLSAMPGPSLSPEEQAFIDGPVEELCGMLDEWAITHVDQDLPPQAWEFLKANKFFGMIIPKRYGGLEFSAYAHSRVLAKVTSSAGGATAGSIVAVPNSLGPAELLLHYGTDEQKDHYLPRLAVGEEIPCFGLTSPWAGSDAGAIPDTGVICKGQWQGEEVLGMRLNFDKRYITLAPVATVVGLAFKLYDPDSLLGDQENLGITCALIPRDTPGLEIGKRHLPVNIPFMNGPVRGKDIFVPLDYIIGGAKMAGEGWRMLMECLAVGRSISLPSNATGGALFATAATGAYARIRRQFNISIGQFEGIQEALGTMGGLAYASEATREFTSNAVDLGEKPSVPSAIAKMHCTEMAQTVSKLAMDVHAGKGVMIGPSNWIARNFQGSPIAITVEGANILTRNMMIFGQGAIRCHPYVLKEIEAVGMEQPSAALEAFDSAFFGHLGHSFSAAARSLVLGASLGRLAGAPNDGPGKRYYQQIARYSANLALLSDLAMASLGGSLKFRERLSARMGDLLSHLYIASATLKRFEDQGRPVEDVPLLDWVCQHSFAQAEAAIDGFLTNLPSRPVAWLARALVFPVGRWARSADDATGRRIAEALQEPGPLRERLFHAIYQPSERSQPLGLLQQALTAVIETEHLERRLLKAARDGLVRDPHPIRRIEEAVHAGVLKPDDGEQLLAAYQLIETVCQVDEFDEAELKPGAGSGKSAKPAARKSARKSAVKPAKKAAKKAVKKAVKKPARKTASKATETSDA